MLTQEPVSTKMVKGLSWMVAVARGTFDKDMEDAESPPMSLPVSVIAFTVVAA